MQNNKTKTLWLIPALAIILSLTLTPPVAKILLGGAMFILLAKAFTDQTETPKWALFFLTDAALLNLLQSGKTPVWILNPSVGLFITTLLIHLSRDGRQYNWTTVTNALRANWMWSAALASIAMSVCAWGIAVYYTVLFSRHGNPWGMGAAVILSSFGVSSLVNAFFSQLFPSNKRPTI